MMPHEPDVQQAPARSYEFLEVIVESQEDRVILAKDEEENHKWIIKEIYPTGTAPEEIAAFHRRFLKKARQLAALKHPCLPRVAEFFIYENNCFLVKEYIEGRTVRDIVEHAEMPIPEDTLKSWIMQLCDVVAYLHSQDPPVLLEGLMPGNILVPPMGRIRIIDLGISRFLDGEARQRIRTKLNPAFTSPEQARGEEPNEISDIYTIGAIAYYLFTKMMPVATAPESLSLAELRPGIAPEINRAVKRALQPRISQRFLTVEEFKDMLARKELAPSTPPLVIDIPYLELNNVKRGEIVHEKFRITREDQGEVRGKLTTEQAWIRLPFDVFAGKFNLIKVYIDTSTLSVDETNYGKITIKTDAETREIPVSVNLQKTIGKKLLGFIFKEQKPGL